MNETKRTVAVVLMVLLVITAATPVFASDDLKEGLTLKEYFAMADGKTHIPEVASFIIKNTQGNFITLKSEEYSLSYFNAEGDEITTEDIISCGVYKVKATAIEPHTGEAKTSFTLVGKPQVIKTAKTEYILTFGAKPFSLTTEFTGDGSGVSYSSSDEKVAKVSADGIVTVNAAGRAVITAKTVGDILSQPARLKITITIKPKKTTITKLTAQNKQLTVKWDKVEYADKYEIVYSTDKKFSSKKCMIKTVKASELKSTTQSTTIKNLKSGTKYYVRVLAKTKATDEYGTLCYVSATRSSYKSVKVK